ncbi:MAG: alkaline phosphatase family protein [Kiritimatiellae bacterium]|nr:alkaline phosphatase family protein [Kiritimatiellia bacterium]
MCRILIGLDGMPFELMQRLVKDGVMPNLGRLMQQGSCVSMRSSLPSISSVAWSSVITGVNPGRHGIFGFTDLEPNSYKYKFPMLSDLCAEPFWETLNRRGLQTVVINVPATYPAPQVDGLLISGFVVPDFEQAIYPKELLPVLKEMNYRVDLDLDVAKHDLDEFMDDLLKVVETRINFARRAWESVAWDVFMLVFTETDRLHHFLFDAVEDRRHSRHERAMELYCRIDSWIGEILNKGTGEERIIVMSDHGFCRLEQEVHINVFLGEQGWLCLREGGEFPVDMLPQTKAFALDPCRIYLHRKGRFPCGSVMPEDEEKLVKELESALYSMTFNGRPVVKKVFHKKDIYTGPQTDRAPDMVVLPENGFDFKAAMTLPRQGFGGFRKNTPRLATGCFTQSNIFAASRFAGMHTYENAFLMCSDKNVSIPTDPDVSYVRKMMDMH